jgi:predicted GIY-YIG superfamily endonuclease
MLLLRAFPKCPWIAEMDGASIYILRCADGSYYTGITRRSVDERVSEHAQGLIDSYTARRLRGAPQARLEG